MVDFRIRASLLGVFVSFRDHLIQSQEFPGHNQPQRLYIDRFTASTGRIDCVSEGVCAFQPSTVTCTCLLLTRFLFNYCVCSPAFSPQPPWNCLPDLTVCSQPTLEQTKEMPDGVSVFGTCCCRQIAVSGCLFGHMSWFLILPVNQIIHTAADSAPTWT